MDHLDQCILRLEQYLNAMHRLQDGLIAGLCQLKDANQMMANGLVISQNHTAIKEITESLALLRIHKEVTKQKSSR